MIDRFGQKISVYWAEHELLWVRAALTLDFKERQNAYRDIAFLTTRTLDQVRRRAKYIKDQDRRQAQAATLHNVTRALAVAQLPPSQLRAPTMAQLMGCR